MSAQALATQISFLQRRAEASGGLSRSFGSIAVAAGRGQGSSVDVLVPRNSEPADLDQALDYALQLGKERKGPMGCWAEDSPAPRWVTAAAVSRGMQWGWTARWMRRSMSAPFPDSPAVEGIEIRVLEEAPEQRAEISYVDGRWAKLIPLDSSTTVLGAFDDGVMVGTVALHLYDRVGGVYDFGVTPSHQRRGIGRALMISLLRLARDRGLEEVVLNSTEAGAGLYSSLGFEDVGKGQTWWINADMWDRPPPTSQQAEVSRLVAMDSTDLPRTEKGMLPCNMTPMRLASATASPNAATALEKQGISLDALSAWDLGWKDRAQEILRGTVDELDETEMATVLQVAIQRDDRELAGLCLRLGARTDVKDGRWNSDALGWCRACGRGEIEKMIREREGT